MSLYKELNYTEKIREINGVQFSVMGPDEIRKRSVVNVTQTVLYDTNGNPIIGGLFDPRMGVIDHGKICPTDGLDNRFCPGYFGHIELARPVFHVQFIPIILKILKCICIRCSKLLIDIHAPEIQSIIKNTQSKKRFTILTDKCSKIKICGTDCENGCGALQPNKYIKDGLALIYAEWKDKSLDNVSKENNRQLLNAEFIQKIFKRISNEECEAIGLSGNWCRPEWLICEVLPVSPPAVRPSVKQFNNQRSEDDITHKLIDILKTNNHLKKKIDNEKSLEKTVEEWTQVLQYHVATLVDNELPGVNPSTHRSGRILKTLRQRLKGKEGRIRGNLMGKRVDFSARSVITPDPNIKIDELGVPKKIAMNLTYPDIVTKYNKKILQEYVRNGPLVYPGAKSVKRKIDGKTTSLQYIDTYSVNLEDGDIVHRHLINGDIVLFNRQPSLHKMSMMGHRVRVMDYNTFRLNVSVTKPYNADFDGDEMNMHVPQSLQTSAELLHLTSVPNQIISPREHKPVISLVQDSLLGLNRITNDDVYLNREEMMNILIYLDSFDGNLPEPNMKQPYERWTGRQLVSIAIPKGLNINMKNNSYNEDIEDDKLNHVIIKDGILVQGRLDSKIMNTGSRGLIHIIYNDYGVKIAQRFLDDLQNIVTRFLVVTGFSVGIGDLVADNNTNEQIKNIIVKTKKQVAKLNQQVHQKIFENIISDTLEEEFEKKVNNLLNKAISDAGKVGLKSLKNNNRMTNMVSAGSKGKTINIAQMIACLGQQNVDGKRIPNSFNDRSLPHFCKYDISPESKGFVESSFIQGLKPQEFFFHAMGGREGLIDTAVKTSETGYIQRKLIKAMEDLKTQSDFSVRNASGTIIQFSYGEDGMDYCKIENQASDLLRNTYESIEKIHRFYDDEDYSSFLNASTIKEMKSTKNYKQVLDNYFMKLVENIHLLRGYIFKNSPDNQIQYPINLFRMINNIKNKFAVNSLIMSNLNPLYIISRINELENELIINELNPGNKMLMILIEEYLSPKKLLKQHKLNKVAFDFLIENIKIQFNKSIVQVSEMVGPIAAQSLGEPATQMTLNTFHFAGVSSKSNVTRGVPRLKELLHISKSIKAPSTNIFLDSDIKYDKTKAQDLLNTIELTALKDLVKSINVYFDPDDNNTVVKDDTELLEIYKIYNEMDPCFREDNSGSDWIIRLEFYKQDLINKNITMEEIYHRINLYYGDSIKCVYSDDNSNKLIFRARMMKFKKSDNYVNDLNIVKQLAQNMRETVIIKGLNGINSASMYKNKMNYDLIDNDYIQQDEWVVNTNGINLIEILTLLGVDSTRTYSNDIYEIYDLLGIEAARTVLMNEIKEVIDNSGNYVNYRHLSLLCDIMTNRGSLMSIDRFGINRGNIGPLAKCSFEETTDQLFKASIFGEVDNLSGVSSNIMMGQIPPCGTGDSQIIIDETKLLDIIGEDEPELDNLDQWISSDYCTDNVGINYDEEGIDAEIVDNIPVPEIDLGL
jgi:DNA-directed RNA polymerase II subunit RPB1